MSRNFFVLVVTGFVGLTVLLLAGRWIPVSGEAAAQKGQAILVTPEGSIVSREQLQNSALDAAARSSLAEKVDILERVAADQQAGELARASKDEYPSFAIAEAPEGLVEEHWGIMTGDPGLVDPRVAVINNLWVAPVDGGALQVAAGNLPDDSGKGLVVIQRSDEFSVTDFRVVEAPEGITSLWVKEEQAGTLVLINGDGKEVLFDLETLEFVK